MKDKETSGKFISIRPPFLSSRSLKLRPFEDGNVFKLKQLDYRTSRPTSCSLEVGLLVQPGEILMFECSMGRGKILFLQPMNAEVCCSAYNVQILGHLDLCLFRRTWTVTIPSGRFVGRTVDALYFAVVDRAKTFVLVAPPNGVSTHAATTLNNSLSDCLSIDRREATSVVPLVRLIAAARMGLLTIQVMGTD